MTCCVSQAMKEIYKRTGEKGGLANALIEIQSLRNDLSLEHLFEVRFTICLVNEVEGLDRDKRDALIQAIAKDIAGAGRRNEDNTDTMLPIDIDNEAPNADVRIVAIENNPSPADPSIPEIMISMSVLARDADFAQEITNRILKAQYKADTTDTVQWPTAMARMIEGMQKGDTRDESLESLSIRFLTNPQVHELSTDFIKHSRLPGVQSCIPQRREAMSTLLVGGRDPYKNDLLKWIVGVDPQQSLRSPSLVEVLRVQGPGLTDWGLGSGVRVRRFGGKGREQRRRTHMRPRQQ